MAQTNYWKVGLFVVLGIGLLFGCIGWLGAAHFEKETRAAVTYLDESVQGLEKDAPVKIRGVKVGRVDHIGIAQDHRRVEIWMEIYVKEMRDLGFQDFGGSDSGEGEFLPPNVRISLAAAGITGTKFLEIDFTGDVSPLPDLDFDVPWEYMPAQPSTLKSLEEHGLKLLESLPGIAVSTIEVLTRVETKLEQFDLPRLQDRLDGVLEDVGGAARELSPTLEQVRGLTMELRKWTADDGVLTNAVAELGLVGVELRGAVADLQLRETSASFRDAADSVALAGGEMTHVSVDLRQTMAALRDALGAVRALAARIERDPGILIRGNSGGQP